MPFNGPQKAPGGGPPVDRAELEGAARRLEGQGYKLQTFKGSWWPLSSKQWRDADVSEGVDRLTQDQEIHLVKNDRPERVLSQQDLIELDAFNSKSTDRLPAPELAGSLAALAQQGTFQGDNGNLSTYETYNLVLGDSNHERQSVRFVKNGSSYPIRTAEDAQTAAWLIAGYGDGTKVAPRAVQLKQIKELGYAIDPWRTYSTGSALALTLGGQMLGSMPLDKLDPKKAEQLCQEWKQAQERLGHRAGQLWELVQIGADKIPVDQRLDGIARLQDAPQLYRSLASSLGPEEKLKERVDQALAIGAEAPSHKLETVYDGWRRYGESYPRLLERTGSSGMATRLAQSLPADQEASFYGMLDDLKELEPGVAQNLALTLVEQKALLEQRALVTAIAAPATSAQDILAARDSILEGQAEEREKLFLAYRDKQAPVATATRLLNARPAQDGVEMYGQLRQSGMEDRIAVPLLERMTSTLKPDEKLDGLLEPALKLHKAAPKNFLESYAEMRRHPGREDEFLSLLGRTESPKTAAALLEELTPEQSQLYCRTWDSLKEKGLKQGPALLAQALAERRLEEDAARLERIPSVQLYTAMVKQAPAGTEEAFLQLAATPKLQDLSTSWQAVSNGLPDEVHGRLALWQEWQPKLGDRAANRLITALKAGQKLDQVAETLEALQARAPKEAIDSFEKIYQSRSADLLAHLVRGGANLAEATEMARRVGRKDLPGAQLPETDRCEMVGRLGKLRGGKLQEGFQDYLFLATRLDDFRQLPMAVDFFATLVETGLSPEEARMAYVELSRREEMGAHQESVLKTYRFAPDLAGAREILEQVIKLSPPDASARLDQVANLELEGLEPRLRSRLAAGHLVAPLSPEGLESLSELLGARGLYWEAKPGWTVAGSLKLDLPRGTKAPGAIESAPLKIEDNTESVLSFDWATKQPSRLLALVEGAKEPVVLASADSNQKDVRVHLGALRGKKVRLRLESTRADEQKMELSQLRLRTTKTVGRRDLTLNDFYHSNGELKEPVTLSSTADTHLYMDITGSSWRIGVDVHDGKDWVRVGTTRGEREEVSYDLSAYRGQKIHLRLLGHYDGGWRMRPALMQLREDPEPPETRPLIASSQSHQVAEQILATAFDPQLSVEKRVGTVRALQRLGDDLEAAWKAWPMLEPHTGDADFEDRVEAVKALLPEVGLLGEVEQARQPGETLAAVARLRKGRSAEDFARIRQRIGWESQGESFTAGALDFVGRVQALAGVEAADRAWEAVAPPIHDEPLKERTRAYLDLLEGCDGDGQLTEQVYRKLLTWVEPSEGIQRACRAAVELHALAPKNADWVKLVETLQASQLEGRLEGVMLKRMSAYLIGKVTLEGVKLEEALKLLPEELQGKTGIEEREQHLVVGGIRLGRRD